MKLFDRITNLRCLESRLQIVKMNGRIKRYDTWEVGRKSHKKKSKKRVVKEQEEKQVEKENEEWVKWKSEGDIMLPKFVLGNPGKSSKDPLIASTAYWIIPKKEK